MSQAWKQTERKAAKIFGGSRNISRGSNFSSSEPDIINTGPFTIEVKYRKNLPKWATQILSQAKSYDKDKTPIGYLQERYKKDGIVIMNASDFIEWFGDIFKKDEY